MEHSQVVNNIHTHHYNIHMLIECDHTLATLRVPDPP